MSYIPLNENAREWAKAELFRWQHGSRRVEGDKRELDRALGLLAMAEAMERGNPAQFPTMENTINVMRYAAERIQKLEKLIGSGGEA